MTQGKKTGGRDFQPGQSGNPNGRPPLPEDMKQARKLNKVEFERMMNQFIYMPLNELEAISNDRSRSAIEVAIAKLVYESANKGDMGRTNFIVERMVGAVKRAISVDGGDDPDAQPIKFSNLTTAERLALVKAARGEGEADVPRNEEHGTEYEDE